MQCLCDLQAISFIHPFYWDCRLPESFDNVMVVTDGFITNVLVLIHIMLAIGFVTTVSSLSLIAWSKLSCVYCTGKASGWFFRHEMSDLFFLCVVVHTRVLFCTFCISIGVTSPRINTYYTLECLHTPRV